MSRFTKELIYLVNRIQENSTKEQIPTRKIKLATTSILPVRYFRRQLSKQNLILTHSSMKTELRKTQMKMIHISRITSTTFRLKIWPFKSHQVRLCQTAKASSWIQIMTARANRSSLLRVLAPKTALITKRASSKDPLAENNSAVICRRANRRKCLL